MKKLEITVSDATHRRLKTASKRMAKSIDQLVQELLAKAYEHIDDSPCRF